MTDFLLHLGWLTVSMSAVILLVLLFIKFFGKRFSAKSRYTVWTVVMLSLSVGVFLYKLPAVFTFEVRVPSFAESEAESAIKDGEGETNFPSTEKEFDTSIANPTAPAMPITPIVPEDGGTETGTDFDAVTEPDTEKLPILSDTHEPEKTVELSLNLPSVLFILWTVGAAVFLSVNMAVYFRSTHKYARSKKLCDREKEEVFRAMCKRYGIENPPRFYVSADIGSPVLYGYTNPTVLLPEISLSKNSLVGVLAHELTHYKRGDIWVKLLCLFSESLYWFNPLVHIAAARCNAEMELSCDEEVLSGMEEEVRRSYGNVMLSIVKNCSRKRSLLTTQYSPNKNAVRERIVNILDATKKKRGRVIIALSFVLCLVAAIVIGCGLKENSEDGEEAITDFETENGYLTDDSFARLMETPISIPSGKYPLGYWLEKNESEIERYALVDLDGDGKSEIVLHLSREDVEYLGTMFLYGNMSALDFHSIYYKPFHNLKTDGSYYTSNEETGMKSIGKLELTGDEYVMHELAYNEKHTDGTFSYYIADKSVSESEFSEYFEAEKQKDEVLWHEKPTAVPNLKNDSIKTDGSKINGFDIRTIGNYPEIEAAIRESIGKEKGELTVDDFLSVRYLDISDKGISDITPVSALLNLVELFANSNKIKDISPLEGNESLYVLGLGENSISDLSPLASLVNLSNLCLDKNPISDLTPLSELTNLVSLEIVESGLSDISPLSNLNVTDLNLDLNNISDISPLSGLKKIERLKLNNNPISDLTALKNLTTLGALYVVYCPVTDFTPVSHVSVVEPALDGGYEYDVTLADGTVKTLTLFGYDPQYYAETYSLQLDNSGIPNPVVIHKESGGTGIYIDGVHVLDGKSGDTIPVTAVADVVEKYVKVSLDGNAWILEVSGKEYRIEQSRFSDYPSDLIYDTPDFSYINKFSVSDGQLICTVKMLCAGINTGYADEEIVIRYGYEDGKIVPKAVTVENGNEIAADSSAESPEPFWGKDSALDNLTVTVNREQHSLGRWIKNSGFRATKYSVIDLDGNGKYENVIWLAHADDEYFGYVILHEYSGTVYATLNWYRQFNSLSADGTFSFSGGVSNHGIARYGIDGDKLILNKTAYCEIAAEVSYYVDGRESTQAEFNMYMETYRRTSKSAKWNMLEDAYRKQIDLYSGDLHIKCGDESCTLHKVQYHVIPGALIDYLNAGDAVDKWLDTVKTNSTEGGCPGKDASIVGFIQYFGIPRDVFLTLYQAKTMRFYYSIDVLYSSGAPDFAEEYYTYYGIRQGSEGGDELYSPYSGYVNGIVSKKDTFSENYGEYMQEWNEKIYKERNTRPSVMYYLVKKMNLTREDLEKYYGDGVPEEIYRGLLTDSLEESMQLLKSEYSFYNSGKLYTMYDILDMYYKDKYLFDIDAPEYEEAWKNIRKWLASPNCTYTFSEEINDFINHRGIN